MLVAGDVGGTKTDLAVYSGRSSLKSPVARKQFHSADYGSLHAIVAEFLAGVRIPVSHAVFGVPGPVINGSVATTNLPWVLDEPSLAAALGLKSVHLMNDLQAVAHAIPRLEDGDVVTLNIGEPVPYGPIGVIAPGTGLGESFLIWNGSGYVPQVSEGGHMNFAPSDERQIRLLEYLLSRFEHVSVERVCSGIGIPNIYRYLRDVEDIYESPDVAQQVESVQDPTKAIVDAAFDAGRDTPRCRATIEMFVSILGSEAGNLALKVLATGGIYLAGGVAVHTLRALQEPSFMKAFTDKGRLADLMKRVPVHIIVTNAALSGAAVYAFEHLRD